MPRFLACGFALLLFISGCSTSKDEAQKGKSNLTPVAFIDGEPIYKEEIGGMRPEAAVELELLYEEALRRAIEDKDIEKQVERYKKEFVVNTFSENFVDSFPQVGDKEAKAYYNTIKKDQYTFVRVAELIVEDRSLAEKLRKEALAGKDFEKLVEEYSIAPSKARGGILRFNMKYYPLFKDKNKGAISDVIEENGQYKVLKLVGKRTLPYERVSKTITHKLTQEKGVKALEELISDLKKKSEIEIVEK